MFDGRRKFNICVAPSRKRSGMEISMKSYLNLAWKELRVQKVTAVLILIAVIMSTVMTTVIGQSIGILQSMRVEQAAGLNGNRYATFHQLTEEQAQRLHGDGRLYDVGDMLTIGSMELGNSGLTLFLREYHDNTLAMYPDVCRVKEGCLPEHDNEIALPEDALKYLGGDISVGDTVTMDLTISTMSGYISEYAYRADFLLTAILENNYVGYAAGTVNGIVGNGAAVNLLPEAYLLYSTDFKTHSKAEFQDIVDDLAAALNVEERYIQYNWVLLNALGISYDEAEDPGTDQGFPFMVFACILVGVLVLAAAGLVIYNILKISITKRIGEYGTLRAIGSERGQIYRLVSLQILILCGMGIPVGMLLGVFSAKGALAAATGILNPELFLAGSTAELNAAISSASAGNMLFLLASAAVTLLFAMTAAFPAARYASHVSPTVAMSGTVVRIKRKIGKNRKIKNFEAYYARLNLKRGRGRTVITILSLVMSITVYIALQSFTSLLDTSSEVKAMHLGDYAVSNETTGIGAETVDTMRANEMVEGLSTSRLAIYNPYMEEEAPPFDTDLALQSHETLQIVNVDEERAFSWIPDMGEQDREDFLGGEACLIKNPIPYSYNGVEAEFTDLGVGDVITLGDFRMRVAGVVDVPVTVNNEGFVNGVQVIVSDRAYCSLVGNDRYAEIYPVLRENVDPESFESWLEGWCGDIPGTHWLSYRQSDAQMEESFEQIKLLCFVLILFIGIIGILNIINTVYSNIHTRVAEIGMQRAIGMGRGSLYRTFLWEGAYYGIFASAVGSVLGYICVLFIGAAKTDALQLVEVPLIDMGEAAALSIAACLLATAIPLRAIAKMNIVESIENVE